MNIHEKSWGTWVRAAAVHIMNRCVDVSITPCHADPNAHTVPRHTTPHHGTPRTPRYVDVSAWTRVCQETGSERAGERVRERERERWILFLSNANSLEMEVSWQRRLQRTSHSVVTTSSGCCV